MSKGIDVTEPKEKLEEQEQAFSIPAAYSTELRVDRNTATQLLVCAQEARLDKAGGSPAIIFADGTSANLVTGPAGVRSGERALYVGRQGLRQPARALADPTNVKWLGDLSLSTPKAVRDSWLNALDLQLEDAAAGIPGLRPPQIGAIYAVLAHWTTGALEPATVVMPTGTGKTDTMVAVLVAHRPQLLLVLAPSDALRSQIARKFERLGVLPELGLLSDSAFNPVVGEIGHGFSTKENAEAFAAACNVIVSTPQALFASSEEVRNTLIRECTHLFVDEAHHVEARTWREIRDAFEGKLVVQFTATPFREDGRRVAGRMVYAYPLREAQRQGYFSKINYMSVVDLLDPDRAIAERAIEQLRSDLGEGNDHILMARTRRIGRAKEVHALYEAIAGDFSPVLLHSSIPARDRERGLGAVFQRKSRVIVCVDMLGEGFDLPALKIAALHDPHKSLAVTLQFIGRFARTAGRALGEATVVTGRPDGVRDENLSRLYAQEPDWNLIIRDLSEGAIEQEREVSEFENSFSTLPEEVSLRNVEPKMSTVVYRTQTSLWHPHAVHGVFPDGSILTEPIGLNQEERVLWFVVESRTPVRWGDIETIYDTTYDLYVAYWDQDRQLLYINSSNTDSLHERLAEGLCGDTVKRISGDTVYRVMGHVNRLVPTNVGLLDVRNRSRRFSMHVGADVVEGFPIAEAQTKAKTNIFALGFEEGVRVSFGASLKGRIWSYRVAPTIKHWVNWCDHVGGKLTDPAIVVDEVMKGFIRPQILEDRPGYVVLGAEWPWELLSGASEELQLCLNGECAPLIDADVRITTFSDSGPIPFSVETPAWQAGYVLSFGEGRMDFRPNGPEVEVVTRRSGWPLSDFLGKHGLTLLLEEDAVVVPPAMLLKPDRDLPPFERERLGAIDWTGVDISRESQGKERDPTTVQGHVFREIIKEGWDVLLDDDGTGEIADIVGLKLDTDSLVVHLVHCKYSSEPPGARVTDLYELCGQAQRSVRWRRDVGTMLQNLIRRERNRQRKYGYSGLIVGTPEDLYHVEEQTRFWRSDFRVTIAQPGLSKRKASQRQLELLGATEVYLYEVASAPLHVLCSA